MGKSGVHHQSYDRIVMNEFWVHFGKGKLYELTNEELGERLIPLIENTPIKN